MDVTLCVNEDPELGAAGAGAAASEDCPHPKMLPMPDEAGFASPPATLAVAAD